MATLTIIYMVIGILPISVAIYVYLDERKKQKSL